MPNRGSTVNVPPPRNPMRVFILSAFLIVVAMSRSVLIGQQIPSPPITFREGVDYVQVDALVTDRAGNVVRGLTKDDFRILEDGKPQNVAVLSFVDIPIRRGIGAARASNIPPIPPSDVETNVVGGRTYAVV